MDAGYLCSYLVFIDGVHQRTLVGEELSHIISLQDERGLIKNQKFRRSPRSLLSHVESRGLGMVMPSVGYGDTDNIQECCLIALMNLTV